MARAAELAAAGICWTAESVLSATEAIFSAAQEQATAEDGRTVGTSGLAEPTWLRDLWSTLTRPVISQPMLDCVSGEQGSAALTQRVLGFFAAVGGCQALRASDDDAAGLSSDMLAAVGEMAARLLSSGPHVTTGDGMHIQARGGEGRMGHHPR